MSEWEYESLDWIHKVREANYLRTKNQNLEEVIRDSVKEAKKNLKNI